MAVQNRNDIADFLESIGVKELHPENLISESICPLYCQLDKPAAMKNRRHVRYIFKSWQKSGGSKRSRLEEIVSKTPVLRAYKGVQQEISDFVVPRNAYLPQAYIGDNDLETYFSVFKGDVWFIDDKYLKSEFDPKIWLQFLKAIGAMDTLGVTEKNIARKAEDYQEFVRELAKRNIKSEYTTRWWKTSIKDLYLRGLSEMLDKIGKSNDVNLSRSLWQLLVKIVNPLPSKSWERNTFFNNHFQGIYRWFYRTDRWTSFDATFYRQLKSTLWIPDGQGKLRKPSECFAPTSENRKLLGDSVVYLPEDFDISTEPAKWLAEKLGVHMEADAESVLRHLHRLRSDKEVTVKKIEPLYHFLYSVRPREKIEGQFSNRMIDSVPEWRSKFETEPLIFIPNSKRNWWQVDEVFWKDEGVVFGDERGYLESHYVKDLKSFFIASLAVSERATASDYVNRIQRVKSMKQVANEKIQILYERLWQVMQESNSISSKRLDADLSEEFREESLIFAPNQEQCWWRVDEVFWEDEGVVFGDVRGYLKACYPEILKPFFIALGISERAAPLDYVSGIKEVASEGQAGNPEIRQRIKRLYRRVWQSFQEGGTWQETEEWEQVHEGRYWIGKNGSEWDFFSRHELVYNDHHEYITEIFEGNIPFWTFNDLFDLAMSLEVEGCSQAEVKFNPKGDQEELTDLSKEMCSLRPYIHAFLKSPRLCEGHEEIKSADILNQLSVRLVEELETVYTLKEISLTSMNPRPSFLELSNDEVTGILWLALEADEDNYPLLIGDALRDYYGIKDLGRFTEHLLAKNRDSVLEHWKRDGLQTEFCMLLPDADSKEDEEKLIESAAEELLDGTKTESVDSATNMPDVETSTDSEVMESQSEESDLVITEEAKSETDQSTNEETDSPMGESEIETPIDNETPEIGKADSDSPSEKSETYTELPSDIKSIGSPNPRTSTTTESTTDQTVDSRSEHGTSTVNENPEMGNGGSKSTSGSGSRTYNSSRTSGTGRSGGHSLSTSNRKSGSGGHGGSGGGGENDEHRELKEKLAANPFLLDVGLKRDGGEIEYTFKSGDRVDILLKDSFQNPVTVEVETAFSSGAGRLVGVWQAVKYKHLAAVEYELPCEDVRSILAAPEIPDDVKTECEKLGIEPIEVSNQTEGTDE